MIMARIFKGKYADLDRNNKTLMYIRKYKEIFKSELVYL